MRWVILTAIMFPAWAVLAGCERGDASESARRARRAGAASREGGAVPLRICFPPPREDCSPAPLTDEPNLEPSDTRRAAVMVPRGTVNLARGKAVTCSGDEPINGELAYVTDGEKDSRCSCVVELIYGRQWVQIDLGAVARIYAVAMWHEYQGPRAYRDVVVRISDDPLFARATTVFNNDHDNTSVLGAGADMAYEETHRGRVIDCGGVAGRYVRLYSNGNTLDDGNQYIEVEVHGRPVK